MTRLSWALATCLLLAAMLAVGAWVWLRPRPVPPLGDNWVARVTVLAGDGVAGFLDGEATRARFADPFGIVPAADGSLIVADGEAHRIRRVRPDGSVSTSAGSTRGFADGPASVAQFDTPSGVAIASTGAIYVADTANNAIRQITPDGTVSTLAGGGSAGLADGVGTDARFNGPLGLALQADGTLVVADTYNDRIRLVRPDGRVTTLAGSGIFGLLDGPALEARFDTPSGVAVGSQGTIYVADTANNAVRAISTDGQVTTLSPIPETGYFRPTGIAVGFGSVFVSDEAGRVIEVRPGQSVRIVAGSTPGFADGRGRDARFRAPSGIAILGRATLAVTDRRNALVRIIEPAEGLRPSTSPRPSAPPRIIPRLDFDDFARTPLLWPIHPQEGPFEITGTMGEMRGGEGGERFHAGLDVRAPQGTVVRAVRDGIVSDPVSTTDFDTLNESLRIGPIVYVHQRVGRTRTDLFDDPRLAPSFQDTGTLAHVRVKRGSRFAVGDALGTTNAFNHVHLNIGWPREEINPLAARLVQFSDSIQPTIRRGGIHVLDEAGTEFKMKHAGRLVVAGRVRLVVDAWDQADGDRADRRLGLYRLGYQVLRPTGEPAAGFEQMRETLRFDRLAPDENAARLAYAPGSGIPFFGRRRTRFLYEVTNDLHGGTARAGVWDTGLLEPGDYTVRILATDFSGNVAIGNRDLAVTVVR